MAAIQGSESFLSSGSLYPNKAAPSELSPQAWPTLIFPGPEPRPRDKCGTPELSRGPSLQGADAGYSEKTTGLLVALEAAEGSRMLSASVFSLAHRHLALGTGPGHCKYRVCLENGFFCAIVLVISIRHSCL